MIDGDTIEIHGTRIRLAGIDAPESSQTCERPDGRTWPCGRRAALALADLIGQTPVTCTERGNDRYGRTLAVCNLGSVELNDWLVRQGWAVAYTRFSRDYVAAEAEARQARRNIWDGEFMPPDAFRQAKKKNKNKSGGHAP